MKIPPILRSKLAHATAAVLVMGALAWAAWYGYDAVSSQPIRQVVFAGATERLPSAELDALAHSLQSSPGRPSLAAAREAARHVHWVRDATVRRLSADTLEIRFEAHEPLARWNDDGLVSRRGEVFAAEFADALPRFRGGEGSAPTLAREYEALVTAVAPLGSPIAELRLSPRGAWQATLASGLVLDLGRNDLQARIARLVSAWPELQSRGVQTAHADLRYPNGFALRRTEPLPKEKGKKAT